MNSAIKNEKYQQSLQKLIQYIEKENYKGYDPYDTLTSPIPFRWFGKLIPILALQFQKRNPINIRPLLGIKKDHNPKALGLFLYSYSKLQAAFPEKNYQSQIQFLFDTLKTKSSKGYSGICWGYNFDWASSGKYIQAYSPNIVVTAFISKGLFEYYQLTKNQEALDMLKSIGQFILKDLPRTQDEDGLCFSYTTLGVDCCYNASLLAAVVLSYLYHLTGESEYQRLCKEAVSYVVNKQHDDGHWNYSIDPDTKVERSQIDFHQGYVIDCILDIMKYAQLSEDSWDKAIQKGTTYYRTKQFFENGQSKWRIPKEYPVEIHNQSQGIITFIRTAYLSSEYREFSKVIANWTIDHMQDKKGFFYYRILKSHQNKISFMRWSQAWMMTALMDLVVDQTHNKHE